MAEFMARVVAFMDKNGEVATTRFVWQWYVEGHGVSPVESPFKNYIYMVDPNLDFRRAHEQEYKKSYK